MIEQGTLKEISASELLLKGFAEELTGVLYLKREEILKELYLRDGKLVWAVSNSDVDMLENIIVSENKVDAQTISLLKSESESLVELGKSLVEKGILSFEEFVGYSKDQLDKILTSVLKWSDGVYYFSKDVPAETYISLEINLKEYIHNFIKNKLDMGFVWTRIGSLQEELEKTGDEGLIEKFDLSQEELELFDKFLGDLSIEMISLNFPGMAKEEILKTIYFFMIAGLLIEKPEKFQESPGETILLSDKLEGDNTDLFNENDISEDIEKINLDAPEDVESVIESEIVKIDEKADPDLIFTHKEDIIPEKKDISLSDQLLEEMRNEEGKNKGKLINIILILILFLFIIAGFIFVVLSPEDRAKFIPGFSSSNDITEIDEKNIEPEKKEKIIPVKDQQNPDNKAKKNEKEGIKDSSLKKKIEKKKPEKVKKIKQVVDPFEKFHQGKLLESGILWKKKILAQNSRFSILLELDCMKVSVMNAYKRSENSEKFFILNIDRGGRKCFLVLFGIYSDKKSAEKSFNSVPGYFWKQANPPKVLDLNLYL